MFHSPFLSTALAEGEGELIVVGVVEVVGLFLGWRWPESATDVWDDGREERVL